MAYHFFVTSFIMCFRMPKGQKRPIPSLKLLQVEKMVQSLTQNKTKKKGTRYSVL